MANLDYSHMRQGAAGEAPAAAPAQAATPASSGLHMSGPRLNLNLPSRSGPAPVHEEAGPGPGSHGGTGEQALRQAVFLVHENAVAGCHGKVNIAVVMRAHKSDKHLLWVAWRLATGHISEYIRSALSSYSLETT